MTTGTSGRWPVGWLCKPCKPCLLVALALALVALQLAGCGAASLTHDGGISPTTRGGTQRCNPATQWQVPSDNVSLDDMSLVGPDEAWAVGVIKGRFGQPATGVIYHLAPGQTPTWQQLPQRFPGAELSAIAMDSPTDGWAASTSGVTGTETKPLVLHYTGGSWHPVDVPALDAALHGPPGTSDIRITWITLQLFGPDAGWMFAWTNAPRDWNNPASRSAVVILRYDHGAWTPIAAPSVAPSTDMFHLSAVSADEAWIVGTDYGTTLSTLFAHYLHGAWSIWPQRFSGVTENFTMLSPSDGWAFDGSTGGGTDTLLHYDGTKWSPVALPGDWAGTTVRLVDRVFAVGPGRYWFVVAHEDTGEGLVPGWALEQYAGGKWQAVNWPFADVQPERLAPDSPEGAPTGLVGVGNILHQKGCPPMLTSEVAQAVFLHFAGSSWTREVLP